MSARRRRASASSWPTWIPACSSGPSSDFARDSVAERLTSGGHSRDRRTLFSWLGVSWYLDAPAVDAFLAELASVAAPGSRIVFDYMHASALSGGARPLGARLAARVVALQGEPWTFGRAPDEAKDWLAGLGWTLTENVWFVDAMRRRAWRAFSGGESRSPSARAV
jgi:methyltransferase (TIGR00027 family)